MVGGRTLVDCHELQGMSEESKHFDALLRRLARLVFDT